MIQIKLVRVKWNPYVLTYLNKNNMSNARVSLKITLWNYTKNSIFVAGGSNTWRREANNSSSSWKTGSFEKILRNVYCKRGSTTRNREAEIIDRYPKECQKCLGSLQLHLSYLPTVVILTTFFLFEAISKTFPILFYTIFYSTNLHTMQLS